MYGTARFNFGGGLDGAFPGVGALETGHEGWSSGSGLDESVTAA